MLGLPCVVFFCSLYGCFGAVQCIPESAQEIARVGLSSTILKGSLGLVHLAKLDRSRVIPFFDVN